MKTLLKDSVAVFQGKKIVTTSSKISEEERAAYEAIGSSEDRSVSYVLRELAVRGYVQYIRDGSLRATKDDEELIKTFQGAVKDGMKLAPRSVNKMKTPKQLESKIKKDAA